VRGKIIDGRYLLGKSLGSGGMGEVYLAHDEVLDRDIALKLLRIEYVGDEEFAERFRREARNAAGLSHPNIVQVYDGGESEDGTCYIAMEYVSGGTLKQRIEGTFETRKAAAVAAQIAGALEAAHERGVIHRDIKPQNVLVTPSGDLKVTDFGIARATSAVTGSLTSGFFGTAAYISPEQAMGESVGPASDLYSLGVVLYEMLTGELPFDADNAIAMCMKHVTEPLRPPRLSNPSISPEMDALVVKLLAKDPADRYSNAAGLMTDLERVRDGLSPILVVPEATTQPLEQVAPQRAPRTLAVAAVAMLALLGTLLLGLMQEDAGQGSLPRAQGVTRNLIDPPAKADTTTAKTDAGAITRTSNIEAKPEVNKPDAVTGVPPTASASPTADPEAASTVAPTVSSGGVPEVPDTTPPEDQVPAEAQYSGGN